MVDEFDGRTYSSAPYRSSNASATLDPHRFSAGARPSFVRFSVLTEEIPIFCCSPDPGTLASSPMIDANGQRSGRRTGGGYRYWSGRRRLVARLPERGVELVISTPWTRGTRADLACPPFPNAGGSRAAHSGRLREPSLGGGRRGLDRGGGRGDRVRPDRLTGAVQRAVVRACGGWSHLVSRSIEPGHGEIIFRRRNCHVPFIGSGPRQNIQNQSVARNVSSEPTGISVTDWSSQWNSRTLLRSVTAS